jgi:hypothetical protein
MAKEIGDILSISPAKLDHLLSGYTGGLATDILNALPKEYKETVDIPIIGRLFTRKSMTGFGGKNVQDFYDALQRAESIYRSKNAAKKSRVKFKVSGEDSQYLKHRTQLRNIAERLKNLREKQKKISSKNLDSGIKNKINQAIEENAAKEAGRGLGFLK